MRTEHCKKKLILLILDILKKHSDAEHRLSQADIVNILKEEYSMTVDRKAVKRNLMTLIELGFDIEYTEGVRIGKDGRKETIYYDWYIEREFSDPEVRLLIESILFSKYIPHSQCLDLIKKLEGLSNRYFRSRTEHIRKLSEKLPENKQLFYTIEVLDQAISQKRQVSFYYNHYDVDMKMHPRRGKDGEIRTYIVNPYQIVATNGRYYLICNYDKYDNVSNYRLDRITEIKMLDTPAKPMEKVVGLGKGLNLTKHMVESIYMFSGESARVTFRAKRCILTEIIDWFGLDVIFSDITSDEVTVSLVVNLQAMRYWAKQYSEYVTMLGPPNLVEEMKKDIRETAEKYKVYDKA